MKRVQPGRRLVLLATLLLGASTGVAGTYPPGGGAAGSASPVAFAQLARVSSPCLSPSVPLPQVIVEPVALTAKGWVQHCPPVGDQLGTCSCLGWATAYYGKTIIESVERPGIPLWNPPVNDKARFSPAWVYNQLNGGVDDGVDPYHWTDALQLLVDRGAATFATMPFTTDVTQQPRPVAVLEAGGWKNRSWLSWDFPLDGWDDPQQTRLWLTALRAALCKMPAVLILMVPDNFRGKGSPIDYSATQGDNWSYHAIACVGFNDDWGRTNHPECGVGAVLCANSWGKEWGAHGYVAIRYRVLMILAMSFGVQIDFPLPFGRPVPGPGGPKGEEGARAPRPGVKRRWPPTHPCETCTDVTTATAGGTLRICSPPIPVHPDYAAEDDEVVLRTKDGGALAAGGVVDEGFEREVCKIGSVRHIHTLRATQPGSYRATVRVRSDRPELRSTLERTVDVSVTEK